MVPSADRRPTRWRTTRSRSCWIESPTSNPLGVELFGYLDQGVTLNPASPSDRLNGPVETNYRSNDYQVNGLYLVAERKVDPECLPAPVGRQSGLAVRYRRATGWNIAWVSTIGSRRADFTAWHSLSCTRISFYPLGDHGISFKIGKFYTPIGNEWLINTENFFYSHFLSWNIQPGTHTGVLAEHQAQRHDHRSVRTESRAGIHPKTVTRPSAT